jgi:hypothetical protein
MISSSTFHSSPSFHQKFWLKSHEKKWWNILSSISHRITHSIWIPRRNFSSSLTPWCLIYLVPEPRKRISASEDSKISKSICMVLVS